MLLSPLQMCTKFKSLGFFVTEKMLRKYHLKYEIGEREEIGEIKV